METFKAVIRWFLLHFFPERLTENLIRDAEYLYRDPLLNGKFFPIHSWPDEDHECRFRSVAVPLPDSSRYSIHQGIALLLENFCARPERQDAVFFGLFLKENPDVFKGDTYVFLHKPLSEDDWDLVTVFSREEGGRWSVVVHENKKGSPEPTLFRSDLFIGLYDS